MPSPKLYHIMPGAALQFIDYDLDLSVLVDEEPLFTREKSFAVDRNGKQPKLIFLEKKKNGQTGGTGGFQTVPGGQNIPPLYKIETGKAFECCRDRWLPLPFLEQRGDDQKAIFGFGPTDWVRGFLSFTGDEKSPKYRLTLIFDPQVENDDSETVTTSGEKIYHALSKKNVAEKIRFGLASGPRDCDWFLELPWINDILRQNLEKEAEKYEETVNFKSSSTGQKPSLPDNLVHLAVYATFLEGLVLSGGLGKVEVAKPGTEMPIDVDLVLDIGNSRLTGVLVEKQNNCRLSDCYILPIRDLSEPVHKYEEPVSSRVEFAEPFFGPAELSLDSRGHSKSFPWPSTVRLGPEATRLAAYAQEDRGSTGMSSPKRYLWDTRPQRKTEWYLNNRYQRHGNNEEQAVNYGSFLLNINSAGLPLSEVKAYNEGHFSIYIPEEIIEGNQEEMCAFKSNYSRSSLMMFLLSEIIAQALSAINDPEGRDNRGNLPLIPRRLARVILTVPTAMPLMEQNIFNAWAEMAVKTVWSALGWDSPAEITHDKIADFRAEPEVLCDWDEATCTQVVWLFNEVQTNFNKNASDLFDLLGLTRPIDPEGQGAANLKTLRLASIDIGAGTTDLSITTFALDNSEKSTPRIVPHQDFREGFSVAGDDVLLKIIQTQFIDKIIANFRGQDTDSQHAENTVKSFFKPGQGPNESRDKRRRRWQFVNQVAKPLALEILRRYEKFDYQGQDINDTISVGEVLPKPEESGDSLIESLEFFEKHLKDAGWSDFNLLDLEFKISMKEVHASIKPIMETVMQSLAEVVNLYDCDILILSGRPTLWPAIRRLVFNRPCVPVDRLVFMHEYRVGAAYPFLDGDRIKDPKTTVVTGAMICAIAELGLDGLSIDTSRFEPQPTTRYLGWLDSMGKMAENAVWFKDIDVYSEEKYNKSAEYQFNNSIHIGFRQLESPRWTANRLYKLEFNEAVKIPRGAIPFTVELSYILDKYKKLKKNENLNDSGRVRRTEGRLTIKKITNEAKNVSDNALVVRLQTLPEEDGFWLDTGYLYGA